MQLIWPPCWYSAVALVISAFYGVYCWRIHVHPNANDSTKLHEGISTLAYIHQVWFNFVGAIIGWTSLWLLWLRIRANVVDGASLVLFILAWLGISGYLPLACHGLASAANKLAEKVL